MLKKFSFITLQNLEVDESCVDNDYLEVAINSNISYKIIKQKLIKKFWNFLTNNFVRIIDDKPIQVSKG